MQNKHRYAAKHVAKTRCFSVHAFFAVFVATWAVAFFPSWSIAVEAGDKDFRLTITHVNDTHGHIAPIPMSIYFENRKVYLNVGGFPRLAAKVDAVRKTRRHSVLLHGGDVFQGTLYFSHYGGMADVDLMNLTGFDAMVAGNHEFDKGSEFLARFIKAANFPVLGSNIDASADAKLCGLITPLVIKTFGRNRVAFFGLAPPETPFISSPDHTLIFNDPVKTAKDMIKRLTSEGINMVVVLSHIGFDRDIMLAQAVDGIDIIVGGHSHTLLGDFDALGVPSKGPYPTKVRTPSGQVAFVVQAWERLKVLGVLDVVFDENGMVTKCEGNPVIICGNTFWRKNPEGIDTPLAKDEKAGLLQFISASPVIETPAKNRIVQDRLTTYDREIDTQKSQTIAMVSEDLLHFRAPRQHSKKPGSSTNRPWRVSHLAPLVAESMLWKARAAGFPVDVTIQNAGGIRTDIPKGRLTAFQIYEVLPFGNSLYLLQLNGGDVLEALEVGLSRSGGAFPYVAGMRYTAHMNRAEGDRVKRAEVQAPEGKWQALDRAAVYLVGTNSYLASGGNGYNVFKKAAYRYDTGFLDAETFIEYAKHLSVLRRPADNAVSLVH